jgi:hypothetical protein
MRRQGILTELYVILLHLSAFVLILEALPSGPHRLQACLFALLRAILHYGTVSSLCVKVGSMSPAMVLKLTREVLMLELAFDFKYPSHPTTRTPRH